ncbi:hypothetical protein GTA08_BOTSDO02493 [Neofusicoccum parvum]|uniref:Uncharacterized protein n=1 Tax=Neofusicoccum parvum TaxID=310453 RepID=A0ACB5SNV1_9PEZI|nr:hypothetical protein GTA08_BOTSDO02493 [Neofusicoccum parvum]
MTATLSLAQTTTQSPSSSVMDDDDDDDDSAPLLPHEITSNTPPPAQMPQIKRLSLVSHHHDPALVLPAAPPALHRPQSPLEPFPAFDPTIGPPPSPPPPPPPQPATAAPPAPRLQEKRRTIIHDPRPEQPQHQQPPAPPLSRDDFLPAMIRCHTLFSLAERQAAGGSTAGGSTAGGSAQTQARARLGEAAALLAALERAPAAGPQMIELSTASLRARLRALEGRVAARDEEGEELCEGTARATAWLGEL